MSPNEHKLMVYMFAREAMLIQALFEVLRSRDLLEQGDVEAFESLVHSYEKIDNDMWASVAEQYQTFAKVLGLEGNLPRA